MDKNHDLRYLKYPMETTIQETIDKFLEIIDEPCILIGHSLGGLISLGIAQKTDLVKKVYTLASPIAGLPIFLKYLFSFKKIITKTICEGTPFIINLEKNIPKCHITCFVTTKGNNPLIREKNDGVISVSSQYINAFIDYYPVNVNHFEILLFDEVIKKIFNDIDI